MKSTKIPVESLDSYLKRLRGCRLCHEQLEPRPVVQASSSARLLIVGQAPGRRVHETGIPWNDPSGDTLRQWLDIDKERFYNDAEIAIVPSAFCFPGSAKSGDLPPPKRCAPQWHPGLLERMPKITLTLLIGQYAQAYYLGTRRKKTLTETVQHFREYAAEGLWVLPHPSPRNRLWLRRNPWFEQQVLPELREAVSSAL